MGIGSRVCINFERVAHPCYRSLPLSRSFLRRPLAINWRSECYKRSPAIISSDVPRRISESSTNVDRRDRPGTYISRISPNVMRNRRGIETVSRDLMLLFECTRLERIRSELSRILRDNWSI